MPARAALRLLLQPIALVSLAALALAQSPAPDEIAARARRIHDAAIVIDTHIDTTGRLLSPDWSFLDRHQPPAPGERRGAGARPAGNHVDLPRMREGGLDALFFSIFIPGSVTGPPAVKRALEQIDAVRQLVAAHPDQLVLATTAADVRAAHAAGKVAALMGMEGGHMIDDSLAMLRVAAQLGVRYLTLTHSVHTGWADSSGEAPRHDGLTEFGKDVVRELNRLGVMVDVSHVADPTFWDALEVSRAPLLASHSSCRAISGHPRNMTDEMIKAMAARGGVVQINFLDAYLDHDLYLAQDARQKQLAPLRAELEAKYPGPENAQKRMEQLRAAMAAMPPLPRPSWEKICRAHRPRGETGRRRARRARLGLRRRLDAGGDGGRDADPEDHRGAAAEGLHRGADPQHPGREPAAPDDAGGGDRAPALRCAPAGGAPGGVASPRATAVRHASSAIQACATSVEFRSVDRTVRPGRPAEPPRGVTRSSPMSDIVDKIKETATSVVEAAQGAVQDVSEAASSATAAVGEKVDEVKASAEKTAAKATRTVKRAAKTVERKVQKQTRAAAKTAKAAVKTAKTAAKKATAVAKSAGKSAQKKVAAARKSVARAIAGTARAPKKAAKKPMTKAAKPARKAVKAPARKAAKKR